MKGRCNPNSLRRKKEKVIRVWITPRPKNLIGLSKGFQTSPEILSFV
jgi:hypothetical protein